MANLEVSVGWDDSELERGISDTEKQLQTLERRRDARVRIGADVGDLNRRIEQTNSRLNQLRTSLNQTSTAANNFNRSAASGSNTLTQFSRIAQDAPFGIIGIGNNLTATAEAFSNLSRQAGGAGGALRAVGQSLLGSGGILLAISLVTTGLTYMSQKGLTLGDVLDKLTGNFNEARAEMQKMNVEIAKNAQAEISSVGAYVYAAKNITLSMSDRFLAVKKLQEEYPAYFGNLTKEQILNGQVAGAVRDVSRALIDKAKAAAYSSKIVDLTAKQEELQAQANNAVAKAARALKLNNAEAFAFSRSLNQVAREGGDVFEAFSKYLKGTGSLSEVSANSAVNGFQDIYKELNAVISQIDKYTDKLNTAVSAQIKLEETAPKAEKITKNLKVEAVPELKPAKSTDDLNDRLLKIMRDQLSEDLTALKTEPIQLNIPIQPVVDTRAAEKALIPYYKMFFEFTKQVDDLVTNSISSTFENLGTAIGEAIAQGNSVFGAIGKTLISSLGAFLSEMGSLLIKYGTLAIAKGVIDKALSSGNPIVTVAAGVAAIAVGVALKGVGTSISQKATGSGASSVATSNINSGASYNSPASGYGSSGSSSFGSGTVVFEIAGDRLIGVLKNTMDKNLALGGAIKL